MKTATDKIRLVIFDMDGVIFEGKNFWLELHQAFGTQEEGISSANKYLTKDYDRLVEIVAGKLWKNRPANIYHQMVAERQYQPGIDTVLNFLSQYKVKTAIISSGPYDLALRAQQDLGFDIIYANRLTIENNHISGTMEVMVPDGEKKRIGQELMGSLGIEPEKVIFIGDSDSDAELAEIVQFAVAYNSTSDKLIEAADLVLEHGQLSTLIEHIGPMLDKSSGVTSLK